VPSVVKSRISKHLRPLAEMMQPLSEAPPLPLFAYGRLADVGFVGRLLERRVSGAAALLLDHSPGELAGSGYPVLVSAPGQEVAGSLVRHLTAADFERLDAYQGVAEGLYERRRGEARPAADGAVEAVWVYLPTDRAFRRHR
jgi:hypothetical protein